MHYSSVLDIVIFSDNNLEQIENRVNKLFEGSIFDIKSSSANGNN